MAIAAGSASAAPPPLGSPTDHFRDRQSVGQEGLLSLTQLAAGGELGLDRLTVQDSGVCQQPGGPCQQSLVSADEMFSETTGPMSVRNGFIEADLDTVPWVTPTVPGVTPPRGSLEPGVAIAGFGTAGAACGPVDFCVSWRRPTYDANHEFTGFEQPIAYNFQSFPPVAGTEVALVAGTFDPDVGPSLVVAWVTNVAGTRTIKVANIVAQRNVDGRVQSLSLAGPILDFGGVLLDPGSGVFHPSLGQTSPSLAVGDFAGDGSDQVGVAWAPSSSTMASPEVGVALLDGVGGGGLVATHGQLTVDFPAIADPVAYPATNQLSPDAVTLHDGRTGDGIDHLIIAPGIVTQDPAMRGSLLRLDTTGGGGPVAEWFQGNSENQTALQSVGDVDGDGLDELVTTIDRRIYPRYPYATDSDGNPVSSPGWIEILEVDATGDWSYQVKGTYGGFDLWAGDAFKIGRPEIQLQTSVLDARPIDKQRIAPKSGAVDWGAMPQIALVFKQQCFTDSCGGGATNSSIATVVQLLSVNQQGGVAKRGPTTAISDWGGDLNLPRVTSFALDGRAQLGDPVQGQYTQVEPSVILNSPPTHFDILDGQAYDPNFCYAGNQYMVPPVCFFNTEYERTGEASTEVRSQSTEDWAVSAKVSTDFEILSVVEVEAEIHGGYGEQFVDDSGTTTTTNVDVTVKSLNSDKIYAITRTYDTLEYPLYQPGAAEPSAYVLAVTPHTVSKRWIDSSSPSAAEINMNHQPGNILSYPEDVTKAENPFISTTGVLDIFAHDEFELSDSSDYKYALTQKRMVDELASTEKNWNIGATIGLGGKVAGVVNVKAEVSGDYKNKDLQTTKTTAESTTRLTATMAGIDESFGETAYVVKPFSYWTPNATLVVDYAVEPVVAPPGAPKTWWQKMYGSQPDPTLNLPRLLDFEEQAGITSDAARFISPDIFVLQGECPNDDEIPPPPPAPPLLPSYPAPGAPLCISAEVHNYSLKDLSVGTKVEFYDADPDVGGELIGSVDVGPIGPRDSRLAKLSWTPDARFAGSRPRIFAVVDAGDQVTEVHEDNNKGFRDYQAKADVAIAPRAPTEVVAEPGPAHALEIEWTDVLAPTQPAGHEWLVSAYPDDGGPPIEVTVPGTAGSASIPDVPVGRYRVAVFAVAAGDSSPASHPSEPVDVTNSQPGVATNVVGIPADTTIELSWDPPADTGGGPIATYLIREYREPGQTFPQSPVEADVPGDVTGLTLSGLTNNRPYRFTVEAVNESGPSGNSEPSDPVTPSVAEDPPAIAFMSAPGEGSFTGPSVIVEFESTPATAETECAVDGILRPCRSPLRLSDLEDGSHTIQVDAESAGIKASTPMVAWNVDSVDPKAVGRKLRKLVRGDNPAFTYRGSDQGGAGLAGYEVKTKRASRRGQFSADPIALDASHEAKSSSTIKVPAGVTVCASVRAVDGAGNRSPWTEQRCSVRPFDESALREQGNWTKVRGRGLSSRHALETKKAGPSLSFRIGKASAVKVLALRCSSCGKIAVESVGIRRKVIDLSRASRGKSRVRVFNALWPSGRHGRVRLTSLGGGQVRVDGVAVWRTTG